LIKIILTSDWHLRSQKPRCRLDADWIATQRDALDQIANHAKKKKADVLVIGDIFHSTNETTNEIIGMVQGFALRLAEFDKSLYILAGNHDLPMHSLDNMHRAAIGLLFRSVNIRHINDYPFDCRHSAANFGADDDHDAEYVFKHVLCFPEKERIPPGASVTKPSELFDIFKNAACIFTGDYHRHFEHRASNARMLFNPGCITRQAADMIDYKPSVIYFEAGEHGSYDYERLPLNDGENVVTDEYLEREEERAGRIEAFIERVKSNGEITFDFLENVKNRMDENDFDGGITAAILELLGE